MEKKSLVEYKLEASAFKEMLWALNDEILHILLLLKLKQPR